MNENNWKILNQINNNEEFNKINKNFKIFIIYLHNLIYDVN